MPCFIGRIFCVCPSVLICVFSFRDSATGWVLFSFFVKSVLTFAPYPLSAFPGVSEFTH